MNDLPELPVYGFTPDLGGLLGLILTVVLPIIVGLVTTRSTSPAAKALLLLTLAAAKTVTEAWLMAVNKGVDFALVPVLLSVAVNFGIATAMHFGLYRPAGVSAAAQAIGSHPPR
jgi:hypothetical protein